MKFIAEFIYFITLFATYAQQWETTSSERLQGSTHKMIHEIKVWRYPVLPLKILCSNLLILERLQMSSLCYHIQSNSGWKKLHNSRLWGQLLDCLYAATEVISGILPDIKRRQHISYWHYIFRH